MREAIYLAIQKALEELGVSDAPFVVERPGDFSHGDYATNAALIAAKILKKNPKEVAGELKEKFSRENGLAERSEEIRGPFRKKTFLEGVEKIEIAGPGFINFFLSHDAIAKEVEKSAQGELGEVRSDLRGQTVMVEYTDPNPFKEFHIGHLMSNAIGESVARLLEFSGTTVIRANYQGDVGPHVAKAMYVLLANNNLNPTIADISAAYVEGSKRYEEDPTEKASIDQLNKLIYQQYETVNDETVWGLYHYGRKITLEHFEELYKILGTKFDYYFFESETSPIGKNLVIAHPEVFTESATARIFPGEKVGLHTRVFLTSAPYNLPTYEAKDLGLLKLKKEKANFDFSITVTANEQSEYFKVVLAAAKEIPELRDIAEKTIHVSHGMMRFAEGKMSSRRGNVITGESLLMDLKDAAKEKMVGRELSDIEKTAEHIAVGAVKYAVLKQGSGKDIVFDPEKSLSLQGDSGPYLQYARVRALSIMKAAKAAGIVASVNPDKEASEPAVAARALLERTLIHFSEVIERAAQELEPHYVTTYLTELASAFNSWYASERVVGGSNPPYALLLTESFERTMRSGLQLLGIPAPEEM